MTDPVLRLEDTRLSVEPGGFARTRVVVSNPGTIVEGFRLEVLGDGPAQWAQVVPADIQVYPGQEGSAEIMLSPPGGTATSSGTVPFAVRAVSTVPSGASAVVEGDLEIGQIAGLQAKISPATSSGRWRGRHLVELGNWGNAPARLYLSAADPDEKLAFLISPEVVDLAIGKSASAAVLVRTRKPFLRGGQSRLPFRVVGSPEPPDATPTGPVSPIPDPKRVSLDAAFVQRPILSRWVVMAAVLVVVAVAAAVVLAVRSAPAPASAALGTGNLVTPVIAAKARDAHSVGLTWQSQPGVDSYKLFTLTQDGLTSGVVSVDGTRDSYLVGDLTPGAQYCFQLQAIRGTQSSLASVTQCAATASEPSPSPSLTSGSPSATLTPTSPASSVPSSTASSAPPSTAATGTTAPASSGGSGSSQTGSPGQVSTGATSGGGSSSGGPSSASATGSSVGSTAASAGSSAGTGTPSGTASGTASPTTALAKFTPDQWVAVVGTWPIDDVNALDRAEQWARDLTTAGIPAQVLLDSAYPDLQLIPGVPPAKHSYMVYLGPFGSQAAAQQACQAHPDIPVCLPVRPSPNGR
jgi:uncharacterized membrane protein YgcG